MFDTGVTPVGAEIQEGFFESFEVEFLGFSAAAAHQMVVVRGVAFAILHRPVGGSSLVEFTATAKGSEIAVDRGETNRFARKFKFRINLLRGLKVSHAPNRIAYRVELTGFALAGSVCHTPIVSCFDKLYHISDNENDSQ